MKDDTFSDLLGAAHEALEHARGQRSLRTTTLLLPPKALDGRDVKRLRAMFQASQAVFAHYLNVSTKLVQAWESNRRNPDGAALLLLHIAAQQPDMLQRVRHSVAAKRTQGHARQMKAAQKSAARREQPLNRR